MLLEVQVESLIVDDVFVSQALQQEVVVSEQRHMLVLKHDRLGRIDLPCFLFDAPMDHSIGTFSQFPDRLVLLGKEVGVLEG